MILILDNYDSFTYNLEQYVGKIDNDVKVIKNDELSLMEIKKLYFTHIIISPGPGNQFNTGVCINLINELIKENKYSNILIGRTKKKNHSIIPLYGKKTNLIRNEFLDNRRIKKRPDKILITMGAGDPDNITSWFLNNFVDELRNENVYVLLGGAYKYKEEIYSKFSKLYKNI